MNKLNILLMLMMFALISCYSEPEQVAEPGVFKAPILKMNSSAKGGHGGSTANKALEVSIDLPLITWDLRQENWVIMTREKNIIY